MTALATPPQAPPALEPASRRARRQNRLAWIARHSLAIVLAIMFVTPVVYLVLISLMTSDQALTSNYWPTSWHPENYVKVFQATPLPRYLLNTVLYAVTATVLVMLGKDIADKTLAEVENPGSVTTTSSTVAGAGATSSSGA